MPFRRHFLHANCRFWNDRILIDTFPYPCHNNQYDAHKIFLFFSFAAPFPVNTRKIIYPLHFRLSHCMNALPFIV